MQALNGRRLAPQMSAANNPAPFIIAIAGRWYWMTSFAVVKRLPLSALL